MIRVRKTNSTQPADHIEGSAKARGSKYTATSEPGEIEFHGAVLVADDHEVYRYGLALLLQRFLHVSRVVEADRFEDAIEHLKDKDLALAIFDLSMPGLSTPRDIARVRALRPDVRVVVLSASSEREHILEALSAGVHGYIIKTQSTDDLIDKVRYVLSGEIYVPPVLAVRPIPSTVGTAGAVSPANNVQLSGRQRQVLEALIEGKTNKEIAQDLTISQAAVKMHVGKLLRALGAANRVHAAALGKQLFG